jgi:hypothetical protein
MELSLLLMAAVHTLDLSLAPQAEWEEGKVGGGARSGAAAGAGPPAPLRALSAAAAALLPASAAAWGGAVAAGRVPDACAAAAARWQHSGDPGRRLPPAELRRLVGFKVPAAPLRVDASPVAVELGPR